MAAKKRKKVVKEKPKKVKKAVALPVEKKRRRKVRQARQVESAPASVAPTPEQEPVAAVTQPPTPVVKSADGAIGLVKIKTVRIASDKDSTTDLLTDAQLTAAKAKFSYGALAFALTVKSNRSLRNLFDSIKDRAEKLNLGKAKRLKKPELAALEAILKTPADVDNWIAVELK